MNEHGGKRRLLSATCYLSLMSYSFAVAGWGPCVSAMQESFKIRDAGIGAMRTALFGGFTVAVFAAGYLMQRFGEKRVAIAGPAIMGLTLIGFSMSRGYAAALCALGAAGLAAGLLEAAVNTIVSEMGGERRAEALNRLHIFFAAGAFAASRGAGFLFERGGDWRGLFAGIGVFSIAAAALFIPQAIPRGGDETQPKAMDIVRFSMKPAVLLLGICIFFYSGYEVGLNDWVVPYLERFFTAFGDDKKSATDLLAWFWLSLAAGRVACSIAARYMKPAVMLSVIASLTTVTAIFIFIVKSAPAISVLLPLSAFFSAGIFPTILAIAGSGYPKNLGTVNGIIMGFVGVATIVFPVGIGVISDHFDLKVAMVAVCAFLAAMLACALLGMKMAKGAVSEAGG